MIFNVIDYTITEQQSTIPPQYKFDLKLDRTGHGVAIGDRVVRATTGCGFIVLGVYKDMITIVPIGGFLWDLLGTWSTKENYKIEDHDRVQQTSRQSHKG